MLDFIDYKTVSTIDLLDWKKQVEEYVKHYKSVLLKTNRELKKRQKVKEVTSENT